MRPIPFSALAQLLKLYHPDQSLIHGVAIDSRKIQRGDLFVALPGNRVDGQAFLQEAASKGAVGAIVQEDYQGEAFHLPLLRVPHVLTAFQEWARKSLAQRTSKVVAITGSLGKTTTKEFTSTLLRTHYHVFSSPLSYNSQATLPLSILMAEGDEDFLILEMGMTHPGNIKNLVSIAPPAVALMTTVAIQHADNFSDGLLGISREKGSIFSHSKTELGIFHHDVPFYEEMSATGTCPKKTFSLNSREADYFLEVLPIGVRVHVKGESHYDFALQLPMKVHMQNFLAALTLAHAFEVPWTSIQEAVSDIKLPPMRFERIEKQGILFINDAYNANPDAMKAALESLPKPESGGKVIAVIGEMDALGTYSEKGHAEVAEKALLHVDHLLCLGARCESMSQIWRGAQKPVELFQTRSALEEALKIVVKPGDVVLLKGARAHALDQILNQF